MDAPSSHPAGPARSCYSLPMKLILGAHPGLGLILLPIMFYHQLRLFVGSLLAERYAPRLQGAPVAARAAAHE
jgi:solute carrier family 10 (sodium/bile acid cotransporter), member 7